MSNEDGIAYASFPATSYPIANQSKTLVGFQMTDIALHIVDRISFMELLEHLLLGTSTTFMLIGVASASVTTQIGELTLENLNISQAITLDVIF